MKKYIQEHKYVLLVLYLPIYLIWFALVERMVPSTEGCFVSYLPHSVLVSTTDGRRSWQFGQIMQIVSEMEKPAMINAA